MFWVDLYDFGTNTLSNLITLPVKIESVLGLNLSS